MAEDADNGFIGLIVSEAEPFGVLQKFWFKPSTGQWHSWNGSVWVLLGTGAASDEKVKADATDPTAGYLDAKVDASTIELDVGTHKIRLKGLGILDAHIAAAAAIAKMKLAALGIVDADVNAISLSKITGHNKTVHDALGIIPGAHGHGIGDISGHDKALHDALGIIPGSHGHGIGDISGHDKALHDALGIIPGAHGHAWGDVNKTGSSLADLITRSFLNLSDVPASYAGQAGKALKVKATEDGLEFGTVGGAGVSNEIAQAPDKEISTSNLSNSIAIT